MEEDLAQVRLFTIVLLLYSGQAFSYTTETHKSMTTLVAADYFDFPKSCEKDVDLDGFIRFVYGLLRAAANELGETEFEKRWPTSDAFDAFEFKGFLDLSQSPNIQVPGVDTLPCDKSGVALLAKASTYPDEDGRNRDRLAYGPDRKPISGRDGPYPADPIIMDMGGLGGLRSQAHAHYVLSDELSSNPLMLFTNPEQFAVADYADDGPITLGTEMAKEHFLLALLAASWAGDREHILTLTWLGSALHYVQDASDPLHTVQVGAPCIAYKALRAFAGRALGTFWGFLGELRPFSDVAADIISNYHLAIEAHWESAYVRYGDLPSENVSPRELRFDYLATLEVAMNAAKLAADEARAISRQLFEAACKATSEGLSEYGVKIKDGPDDPTWWVGDGDAIREVLRVGKKSIGIGLSYSKLMLGSALILSGYVAKPEGRMLVAKELLKSRMAAIRARETRLAHFIEKHPEGVTTTQAPFRMPGFAIMEAALLIIIVWCAARIFRRWFSK